MIWRSKVSPIPSSNLVCIPAIYDVRPTAWRRRRRYGLMPPANRQHGCLCLIARARKSVLNYSRCRPEILILSRSEPVPFRAFANVPGQSGIAELIALCGTLGFPFPLWALRCIRTAPLWLSPHRNSSGINEMLRNIATPRSRRNDKNGPVAESRQRTSSARLWTV